MSFLIRRRGGSEVSASDPSRLPCETNALKVRGRVSRFAGRRGVFEKALFAEPLFSAIEFSLRRRGARDVSFLKPSRLSFETPLFYHVVFYTQARWFGGHRLQCFAPAVGNEAPKKEGSGGAVDSKVEARRRLGVSGPPLGPRRAPRGTSSALLWVSLWLNLSLQGSV